MAGAVFFLSFSVASAKNFTIFNATNANQPYFSVNGTTGNVGIASTSPSSLLTVGANIGLTTLGTIYNSDSSRWLDMTGAKLDSIKVPFNILTTGGMLASDLYNAAQIRLNSAGSNYGKIQSGAANTWSLAYSTASSSALGTPVLSWNSVGNVGIGTTAPSQKLEVSGNMVLNTPAGDTRGFMMTSSGGDFNKFYYKGTGGSGSTAGDNVIFEDNRASMTTGHTFFTIKRTGAMTTGNIFKVSHDGSASDFVVYNNGNIGIGTTTPDAKLNVNGTFHVSGAFNSVVFDKLADVSGSRIVMTDSSGALYATSTSVATGLPSPSGIPGQTLRSNGTSWVANNVLYNNGTNVGIGTTAPTGKLQIAGSWASTILTGDNIIVKKPDFPSGGGWARTLLSFQENDGTSYFQIGALGNNNSFSNGYLGAAWNDTTMRWYSNKNVVFDGNVGIGTTTPGSLLTIGNNLGLTLGGTIYGALANRYLDFTGVLPLSLSVPGPIKFGNTASACDSTNTGALRYDAVSGQSYLCDGSRWVNQKNCGLMTDDEGNSYNTVQIGGQCWMAENINVGTMLASGSTMPNTADQIIEKWCYNNDANNCAAYGGLYHFDEAVRGSKVSGARGICPAGWHVPTDAEFNVLEKTVSGIIGSAATQYPCNLSVSGSWRRCADDNAADNGGVAGVGKSLKAVGVGGGNGAGNNLVGFEGKLSGYRSTDSSFYYLGSNLFLWSSSPSGSSNAWRRNLSSSYSTVGRSAYPRAYGFSVRCVRD